MPDDLILGHAVDAGPMPGKELGGLLNRLLEAERAGARLLAAYLDELPPGTADWVGLHAVQRDEARNCAVLIHCLLEAEITPSMKTGEFYRKGLEIGGWRQRLEFLNRGQRWVARRIAEALPRIASSAARRALQEMHASHLENIARCEQLLD